MHTTDSQLSGPFSSVSPPPPQSSYRHQVLIHGEALLTRRRPCDLGIGIYILASPCRWGVAQTPSPFFPNHFNRAHKNALLSSFRFRRRTCSCKVLATLFSPRPRTTPTNLTAYRPGFGEFRISTAKKFYRYCDGWNIDETDRCCAKMTPSGGYSTRLCPTVVYVWQRLLTSLSLQCGCRSPQGTRTTEWYIIL